MKTKGFLLYTLSLSLLIPSFAQGTGIRKVFSPSRNVIVLPISFNERYVTLDGKEFPRIYDPSKFNAYRDLFIRNQLAKLAHYTVLDMIRGGSLAQFYATVHFSDPLSRPPDPDSGLVVYDKETPSLADPIDVEKIISFMEEEKVPSNIQFIVFASLLHNHKVSDSDVLKFVEFMDLPKDFILFASNLGDLEKMNFLDSYLEQVNDLPIFKTYNQHSSIGDVENIRENNEVYVRALLGNRGMSKDYALTSLSHEVASSFRVSLIQKMIRKRVLNFLSRDQLYNSFLHNLAHNPYLTEERDWETIFTELNQDPIVDFNLQNNEGVTFLFSLAEAGSAKAVEILLDLFPRSADIYIRDIYDRSVFQVAAERLRTDMAGYLYKIGGNKLNEITYLNGYVLKDLQPVVLEPTSYFDAVPLIEPVKEAMSAKYMDHPTVQKHFEEEMNKFVDDYSKALFQYESLREQALQNTFLRGNMASQILLAIREGDINFLESVFLKEKRGLDFLQVKVFHPNTGEEATMLLVHMLIEAIRYNQPKSVEFALKVVSREGLEGFMEPLSVAIMTSYLIDYNNEIERGKNLDIIDQLIEDGKIDLRTRSFLDLEPIKLASFAGLFEVVKKLHEEKGVPLDLTEGLLNTDVNHLELARSQGFLKLVNYYETKLEKSGDKLFAGNQGSCGKTFLH